MQNRMNNNGCLVYVLALVMVSTILYFPSFLHSMTGSSLEYTQVLLMLFGMTAVVFGAWYFYMKKVKNPSLYAEDQKYLTNLAKNSNGKTIRRKEQTEGKPSFKFEKLFYGILFWVVIFCTFMSCQYGLSSEADRMESVQPTEWNADNIPLPHLHNKFLYVSNPDSVISQQSVDSMNVILHSLDEELGVESAVIIVNHIENEDAFRMAQDVGNKYGIGKKETDRGLVVVVAYEDHKYFIAPGRGLESMLTDAECGQLARRYLTPFLRANNPDGGMTSLVRATYVLVKEKRLLESPSDEELASGAKTSDEETGGPFTLSMFILAVWGFLYSILNKKYNWVSFAMPSGGSGYTGYGRTRMGGGSSTWGTTSFGRGGGFGGGFGGGYGGGSFGGGGAGGSW